MTNSIWLFSSGNNESIRFPSCTALIARGETVADARLAAIKFNEFNGGFIPEHFKEWQAIKLADQASSWPDGLSTIMLKGCFGVFEIPNWGT